MERSIYRFICHEGLKAPDQFLEEEREQLCGPAYCKGEPGAPVRWGRADGRLVMGGRRVVVSRPRVRQEGKEVALPTWEQFAEEDPLNRRAVEQMIIGVSTRNYERSVEEVPEEYGAHGAATSSVRRRFVSMTTQQVHEWPQRDLSKLRIAVVMIDGTWSR